MKTQTISTDFAANLLSQLPEKENSVISPYGIAAVLSMAAEGTGGSSLDEILSVLGFDSLDALRSAVVVTINNPCEAFKSENNMELQKGANDIALCKRFKQILTEQYAANVSEEESDGNATIQLCNIATFKAKWFVEMERDTTGEKRFYNANGSLSQPAFLSCYADLRCYRDDEFWPTVQAVGLPYKLDGNRIPYELVLVDSEKPLTQKLLQEVLSNMRVDACEVEFPEFSIKSTYDLISMMRSMGVQKIFNESHKSINRMATQPLYAAGFSQEAEIQVDENGTVASAITCMTMCLKGGVSFCDKFRFNKPFSYFLRKTETGEILFLGKVKQLTDCEREKRTIDSL